MRSHIFGLVEDTQSRTSHGHTLLCAGLEERRHRAWGDSRPSRQLRRVAESPAFGDLGSSGISAFSPALSAMAEDHEITAELRAAQRAFDAEKRQATFFLSGFRWPQRSKGTPGPLLGKGSSIRADSFFFGEI